MTSTAQETLIWSVVDGEALLLDTSSGRYFSLNPTATEVWLRLQRGDTEDVIVADIALATGTDPEVVRRDIAELVAELRLEKLWA